MKVSAFSALSSHAAFLAVPVYIAYMMPRCLTYAFHVADTYGRSNTPSEQYQDWAHVLVPIRGVVERTNGGAMGSSKALCQCARFLIRGR
ncbi:hypothetical protein F4821DRAFT_249831 [Hypoxylon rubiginosum]|uniref:Uncharacterized protein n=1 Tax=Hypoxylon rubiginosum TaxID=110542 RepID=A0ACC0CLJ6_9PEZI|nr:hypothetical protein F4821DRAFT_249831 [Hypoxylon rubiginosum]